MINLVECHKLEISRIVDYHLQSMVKEIPSYIEDANHFINMVNIFSVAVNSVLVTMDIQSYLTIPNNQEYSCNQEKV